MELIAGAVISDLTALAHPDPAGQGFLSCSYACDRNQGDYGKLVVPAGSTHSEMIANLLIVKSSKSTDFSECVLIH